MQVKLPKQKRLGTYYTPDSLSYFLSCWAIQKPTDKVLEPSFGGCGFLESTRRRLINLGSTKPNSYLYGCDKDKQAFKHLSEKIGPSCIDGHFIYKDFLTVEPDDFKVTRFDAVVANPPYVSLHNMSHVQRKNAARIIKKYDLKLSKRSSLWAYFLVHASYFLNKGGRAAWVLPSSYMGTNYAGEINQFLKNNFKSILVVPVKQRLFVDVGANESTNILLLDGWMEGPAKNGIEIENIKNLNELDGKFLNWPEKISFAKRHQQETKYSILSAQEANVYNKVITNKSVYKASQLIKVFIGIVTGEKSFFILNKEQAKQNDLSMRCLKPIVNKFQDIKGLSISVDDLNENIAFNRKCLLLNTEGDRKDKPEVIKYLRKFPKQKRESIKTFKKRKCWHQPDDNRTPDGFLSYMNDYGPMLSLNAANVTCTNSVHRFIFKNKLPLFKKRLFVISMLTTLAQLSAEIEGRTYGSGVLKTEPSEAHALSIPFPNITNVRLVNEKFHEMDKLVRANNMKRAREIADQFILKRMLGKDYQNNLRILRAALVNVRANRRNNTFSN